MLDKFYLTEIVRGNFPDLASTKFKFNNLTISSFTESTLLPFLVYQNTVDTNNRLIGLYLPETCSMINLVPFYIIMGLYRKALNKIMQTNRYENQSFQRNEKQVVFEANVCAVTYVDYINRQIVLRSGRGRESCLSFNDTYKINWNYRNALDLKAKIESFEKIDRASNHNIFTFPLSPTDNQYEGVIVFTNTSKFESILKNVKVSGNDLREHLNIQKAILQSDDTWKFEMLSRLRTRDKPISVVIARLDSFRAFSNIISSNPKKLQHIKTIVIDDFDEMALQWQRKDISDIEFNWIKENYYSSIINKQLKDVYLVCKNQNIDIHKSFGNYGIKYYPWLINPLEELGLNNIESSDNIIYLKEVSAVEFCDRMTVLKQILEKWKHLASSHYCQGDVISQINLLRSVQSRISTICDPHSFAIFLRQFEKSLLEFKSKWFRNNLDNGLIDETIKLLKTEFNLKDINSKLADIRAVIEQNNDQKNKIAIISDNKVDDDNLYLYKVITDYFPEVKLKLQNIDSSVNDFADPNNIFDLIIYLSYRTRAIKKALTNVLGSKQIFILDNENLDFAERTARKIQKLINAIGSNDNKYTLLNISKPVTGNSEINGNIELFISRHTKRNESTLEIAKKEENVFDFELFVRDVFGKFHADRQFPMGHEGLYRIFFEDGTTGDFPENRRLFHYDENDHEEEITKYLKDIADLKWGDQVIIPKRGGQLKELLENELNTDADFAKSLKFDKDWRNRIKKRLEWYNGDYSEFRKKLSANGFKVESDSTIRNWLDGDTLRPHNFDKLLIALVNLKILAESDVNLHMLHNSKLKSIQIMFVREAIKKLISHLHGINYQSEEALIDEDLLNKFIELIEIKKVASIIKL